MTEETAVAETPMAEAPAATPAETPIDAPQEAQEAQTGRPTRDALANAAAAVNARMAEKADRDRNPDGTFKSAESGHVAEEAPESAPEEQTEETSETETPEKETADYDGPSRFTKEAQAAWSDTPATVKSEVQRLETELLGGLEKHREAAERFEEYRPLADHLKERGQTVEQVFSHYAGIENELRQNPLGALDRICRNSLGRSLQDVASHVTNQPIDESVRQNDAVINGLRSELGNLKQQLGQVTTSMDQRTKEETTKFVLAFSKDHPRFDELSQDIQHFLSSGRAKDLAEAYTLAERLNPAPAPVTTPAPQAAQPRDQAGKAQPLDKGQLSVNGYPGTGSNPGTDTKPSSSAREAVQKAFRRGNYAGR